MGEQRGGLKRGDEYETNLYLSNPSMLDLIAVHTTLLTADLPGFIVTGYCYWFDRYRVR